MRLVLVVIVLVSAACNAPCNLTHLDDAPASAAGEVRHGLALDEPASVTAAGSGVVCAACSSVFYLDRALGEQRETDISVAGSATLAQSGDITFVLDSYPGVSSDSMSGDDMSKPHHFQLFALSSTGRELWRKDFGAGEEWGSGGPRILAGPASAVVYSAFGGKASVFDPTTGMERWSTPTESGIALVPDATGGLLLTRTEQAAGTGLFGATLRHLDASGVQDWKVTWKETQPAPHNLDAGLFLFDAVRTSEGGFVLLGRADSGALDLGDTMLPIPDARSTFVVVLDGHGATQWAAAVDSILSNQWPRVAALDDSSGVAIAGEYLGSDDYDVILARVDRSGTVTTHPIVGPGNQFLGSISSGGDGSVVLVMRNDPGYSGAGAVMHIGGRTFDDGLHGRAYVLNILP